jgi:hypothetical protein
VYAVQFLLFWFGVVRSETSLLFWVFFLISVCFPCSGRSDSSREILFCRPEFVGWALSSWVLLALWFSSSFYCCRFRFCPWVNRAPGLRFSRQGISSGALVFLLARGSRSQRFAGSDFFGAGARVQARSSCLISRSQSSRRALLPNLSQRWPDFLFLVSSWAGLQFSFLVHEPAIDSGAQICFFAAKPSSDFVAVRFARELFCFSPAFPSTKSCSDSSCLKTYGCRRIDFELWFCFSRLVWILAGRSRYHSRVAKSKDSSFFIVRSLLVVCSWTHSPSGRWNTREFLSCLFIRFWFTEISHVFLHSSRSSFTVILDSLTRFQWPITSL